MPNTEYISHFYIKHNGTQIAEKYMDALTHGEFDDSLYLPDMFTLNFSDKGLEILTEDKFKPGDTIEISVKAPERDVKVKLMEGEITSVEPDLNSRDRGTLVIRGYDRSHKLRRARKTQTFKDVTDSDIATKVAQGAGLQAEVDATNTVHKFVMQTNQTDLEFLLERARRVGFQVYVEDRKLHFKKSPASPPVVAELDWGINLDQFRARLSTVAQVNEVVVRGWDVQAKAAIVGRATSPTNGMQQRRDNGNTGGAVAQTAHGMQGKQIVVDRPVANQGEADKIAQAELDSIAANFIQAEGSAQGDPNLKAGKSVKIKGVGTRFAGDYLITRAVHKWSAKGYTTQLWCNGGKGSMSIIDLLQSSTAQGSSNSVGAEERVTARGVLAGIVTNNNDPANLGRVQVKIPVLDTEAYWCRLGTIMAGPGQGVAYFPEANDEVIVAFEHGDPNRGYIIGSVWNGSDKLPKPIGELVTGGQTIRRISRSRKGHEIVLIDKPGEEGIHLIDKTTKNFIKIITDSNKVHIECQGDVEVMSKTGNITVEASTGNVTIKAAAGKMTLTSMQDLELTSQAGRVKISGTAGVDINSPAQTKVSGIGMLELTSAGITSVKGSILKLN